jgi:hypothetical protein
MYVAITSTSTSTWKAVKRHYFIALAGACLAFAAIVAGSALSGVDFGGSAAQPAPLRAGLGIAPYMAPASSVMTYYIVGSEEQRAEIEEQGVAWQAADHDEYYPNKRWQFAVLMAGTMESETAALATVNEVKARWMAAKATGLEIVDLRQPELRRSLALQRIPIFIYLVDSQEKANNILAAVEDDNESETLRPVFFAFKATTPEEESNVAAFIESWEGREVQVIDYRNLGPIE